MGQDLDTWKVKQETKLNLTIQMETKTIMLLQLEIKETEQERDNKYDIPTKKMIAQLSDELAKGTAQLAKLNR